MTDRGQLMGRLCFVAGVALALAAAAGPTAGLAQAPEQAPEQPPGTDGAKVDAAAEVPTEVPAVPVEDEDAHGHEDEDEDEDVRDGEQAAPRANEGDAVDCEPAQEDRLVYRLERIDVRGNGTRAGVIRAFVEMRPGDDLDPNDPDLSLTRYRLMATGWFDSVDLRLERGAERGWVVLVVEVDERNTLVIERVVAGLSRVVGDSDEVKDPLRPYAGLGIKEGNLFGLGVELSAAAVVSELQQGISLHYNDQHLDNGQFSLRGRAFYNRAREFFGRDPVVDISCDAARAPTVPCDPDIERRRAVVIYDRTGFGIGTGSFLGDNLRYHVDWLGERVDVGAKPRAATSQRGTLSTDREPIDFRIEDDVSYVSTLRLGLAFDTRDDLRLPARGHLLETSGLVATQALGSDYPFARLDVNYRGYHTLPWGHILGLGAFAGSVVGRAPFFYYFYAADLSALLPSRQLDLNLDHRRTHNLLDTAIIEMDREELAGRLDLEYKLPVYAGGRTVRGVHLYAGGGLFLLARRDDLKLGIPGYSGFSRVPVDLTFDVGVTADTSMGYFKLGFSTFVGFLPDLGRDNR